MFLSDDVDAQPGLISLLPQVRDAVRLPVVAAGGISDGRGIAGAFALSADAVQLGTAYLRTPEATISPIHRAALASARDDATRLTNVFTGRPARGLVNRFVAEVGPMCEDAPQFPLAAGAAAPLRTAGEKRGSGDFSPLWAGESAALARDEGAETLTRRLWADGQAVMTALSGRALRVEGPH
jgi:nitronate monooxygenase